jgi:replicative DNA helicase
MGVPANTTAQAPALFDVETEQLLIGAVLNDERAFWTASGRVSVDDFYAPEHQRLWALIATKKERNEVASPLTLKRFAETDADIVELGGPGYLVQLSRAAPMAPMVGEYANVIRRHAQRRRILDVAQAMIEDIRLTDEDPSAVCDRAGEALYDAGHRADAGSGPQDIEVMVQRAAEAAERAKLNPAARSISTGLATLDRELGGLRPGRMCVLGAPPSMGKTGLVQQIGEAAGRDQKQVLMFSKEMGGLEIATRHLAAAARVPADRIEVGKFSDAEHERIAQAPQAFRGMRLSIDDANSLSVAQIRARAQAHRRRKGGLHLVVIDHLGFIKAADPRAPEHERLDQICVDLARLKDELDVALLLISHLNRRFWDRTNKRPVMSDLHGGSSIEKTADDVWFLYREEWFLERDQPNAADQKAYADWATKLDRAKGWALQG